MWWAWQRPVRSFSPAEPIKVPRHFIWGWWTGLSRQKSFTNITYGIAEEIAANAPLSLKGTKKILAMFRERVRLTEKQMAEADRLIGEAFNSDDLKEGMVAFFEKRKPRFTGR